ncbi:MAG: ribonuclease [Alphaproteobacteria bacterium]|jgi:ribonuclease E|nr:ribonuclease [Alphaproteobacteria bacterium]
MANKMLIDATHPEETRVVVLRGNRVEEFDFESANRKQLRGNIYLAKVTRVEPSLQAAFVDYGGNRHGFLAFSEIHPDYYQIPVADRQALIEEEEQAHHAADAEADNRAGRRRGSRHRGAERPREMVRSEPVDVETDTSGSSNGQPDGTPPLGEPVLEYVETAPQGSEEISAPEHLASAELTPEEPIGMIQQAESSDVAEAQDHEPAGDANVPPSDGAANGTPIENGNGEDTESEEQPVEMVGGADALEEVPERMSRGRRQYKIQEVIKRRQVMLVQVVKEERGTKGAALTTYLSLAGRYSVLMPNTARGGGISRKITDSVDRKKLKEIAEELEVPEGMGVILRTAGASRTKTEVKRDFEYLLRLWETVRDLTLKSTAPKLVYEEGSLVKRSIRDLYNKDIEEVVVAGDEAYKDAKDFMRMLMPSHAKNVKPYKDVQPLFSRYGIESQLDAMFSPTVQLRSGGYIVINQAEALVAIDVNSGRATREHHIEDTALKTNLEASEEVARQLRMRDLAGLIVIDFIDMEEKRNNRAVERRLKECLRHDRARIQVGGISHFGLLEMSRQRIRTSVLESSTEKCPLCGGVGHVRSVSSVALQLLRSLEETLIKSATHNLIVRTRADVAIYVLNHKRAHLRSLEERFRVTLTVTTDPSITGQISFAVDRGEQVHTIEAAKALMALQSDTITSAPEEEEEADIGQEDEAEVEEQAEADTEQTMAPDTPRADDSHEDGTPRRKRRRRRRHGGGEGQENREPGSHPATAMPDAVFEGQPHDQSSNDAEHGYESENTATEAGAMPAGENGHPRPDGEPRRRRRGRRGGRRNRRDREGGLPNGESRPEESHGEQSFRHTPDIAESTHVPRIEPSAVGMETNYQPAADSFNQAAAPPTPQPEAEPPRRRSTIREPAPTFPRDEARAPRAEPAPPVSNAPEPQNEEAGKPRKTGWWAKRLLGGNS